MASITTKLINLEEQLELAAKLIQNGQLVAFPTETVYGLGADATNEKACQRIYSVKSRPSFNPLIVHVANLESAQEIGYFSKEALKLAQFWPGPLTLVVKLKENHNLAPSVTANLTSVALRIPANIIAQKLIQLAGTPVAAPSANLSGQISATNSAQVSNYFKQDLFILDGGNCEYGIESTIVDMRQDKAVILRHGFIPKELIESIIGRVDELKDQSITAPGMMQKHYSPISSLRINATSSGLNEVVLNFGKSDLHGKYSLNLSQKGDLVEAAHNLYSMLKQLDEYARNHNLSIAVAEIPTMNIGVAINDRLTRAAHTE